MDTGRLPFARDGFDVPPAPAQPSSHASKRAAAMVNARGDRGEKLARLLKALKDAGHGGLTDSEIERQTGLPRQSICSLRRGAVKRGWVEGIGERTGPYACPQTIWRITESGSMRWREGQR